MVKKILFCLCDEYCVFMFIIYALLVVLTSFSVFDVNNSNNTVCLLFRKQRRGGRMQRVPVCRKWGLQRGLRRVKRIGLWLRRNAYFVNMYAHRNHKHDR